MADDHIIKYSAVDIEKYHKGLLSPKQMHAMEKAALDDPFLADAMEGYAVAGVHAEKDITELKKRLLEKASKGATVVPIHSKRKPFPWLRAAVAVVLIAGAAILVYNLSSPGHNKNIALAPVENKKESSAVTDSIKTQNDYKNQPGNDTQANAIAESLQSITSRLVSDEKAKKQLEVKADSTSLPTDLFLNNNKNAPVSESSGYSTDISKIVTNDKPNPASPNPTFKKNPLNADTMTIVYNGRKFSREDDKNIARQQNDYKLKSNRDNANNAQAPASQEVLTQSNGFSSTEQQKRMNSFRGRVTDSNNNPLPYANITNTFDNVGTYSDVKGNFVLISPDSVLNVQVRSLGYADNNIQLNTQSPTNKVIMSEDHSISPVVISNQKQNTNRSRTSNMVLEEPEPIDGWENYDTYLANNLRNPETKRTTQKITGEVQVSFEVNKDGEPINITVDHSLCKTCDQEAIRLIKEGPKWKRKSKKGRISVTVSF